MGETSLKARQRTLAVRQMRTYVSLKTETALPRTAQTGRSARQGVETRPVPNREHVPKVYGIRPSLREGTAPRRPIQGEPGRTGRLTPALYSTLGLMGGTSPTHTQHPVSVGNRKQLSRPRPQQLYLLLWRTLKKIFEDLSRKHYSRPKKKEKVKSGQWGAPITAPSRSYKW